MGAEGGSPLQAGGAEEGHKGRGEPQLCECGGEVAWLVLGHWRDCRWALNARLPHLPFCGE